MTRADTNPLTAAEAGDILGISGRTVIRRAEAGELEYLRKLPGPNGDYLFERLVVESYARELAGSSSGKSRADGAGWGGGT